MKKKTYMERMSYDSFEYAIKKAKEKSKIDYFTLIIELFTGYLIHGADFIDYAMMGFWELSYKEKKTYLTHERNHALVKKYNDRRYIPLLNNRHLFNEKFEKYLERDYFYIDGDNYDQFVTFLKDKNEIYVKPTLKNGKSKAQRLRFQSHHNMKALYQHLLKNSLPVIEEVIPIHPELEKLVGTDLTSVHIMTFYKENDSFLINAFLKMEGKEILVSPIDLNTGCILEDACTSDLNLYEKHPITQRKLEGFTIPYFEEVKQMALTVAKELPRVRYVDWNIFVGEDGPVLISGNPVPNYSFYQFPLHAHHCGLMPVIKEIEK